MTAASSPTPWVAHRTTATIRGRTFPVVVLTLVQPQVTEA